MKRLYTLLLLTSAFALSAQNTKKNENTSLDSIQRLDEVILPTNVIFGNKFVAHNRTGSSYYISPKELQKFGFTNINRVLSTVPGVNIYEEDGFGLRPNISLRGTSPERSAKISIMEDGVLIAPAPYSAPAAYYFPTIARMQAVEVLKGSSQVQYGPFTTGGAINMVSNQIPTKFGGRVRASYGSFNSSQFHGIVGDENKNFGYMVEYLNYNSDGFKDLSNGGNTGFDKNDLVAKFRYNINSNGTIKQAIEAKIQYSDEVSNETYLGLTDSDFDASPFRRYAGSQRDVMKADHFQVMLTHTLDLSKDFRITTNLYNNNFGRNWYKLDKVSSNGTTEGIADILEDPSAFASYYDIVTGNVNSAVGALYVKANNRTYNSKGIQTKLDYHWYGKETFHDIEVGLRYHYDEEDRFQWVDEYNMIDGVMNLTAAGAPGSNANRISSANAFASFIMYKLKYKNLTITPGVRYENITLKRENFGTSDPTRTGNALSVRENKVDVFIPGIGANYNFSNTLSVFGGIHKGFSPPGNQEGQKPEKSINYELGTRFNLLGLKGEFVGFFNDYSNLLGSDLAATGGTGSLDQFNAGEVNVMGLEVLLNYDLLAKDQDWSLPISFGYTYTDTEFQNSFGSSDDLWGVVTAGDELPYISKHQFNATISLEHQKFQLNLNTRFNGSFRTVAGSGTIPANEQVASNFIVDFAGKYSISKKLNATANIINLFNKTYAVSRVPAGLRPGHPFGVYAGLEFMF
ncbi:TonB-dependent receptor [Flavobacteriaceae bacterium S356]|uniref:TonB-dependent receptor n=1 Tax=Asprobacillus argus TaxID=3076534 RepID=A0ABU3LDW8_9FLAO|nr:TonB-dependent receptor [Flavobacteriaceae bacterium S356]